MRLLRSVRCLVLPGAILCASLSTAAAGPPPKATATPTPAARTAPALKGGLDPSEAEPPRFTGERISLNLKQADIRDVILHLAALSGLSVALHPDVQGAVTLSLEDVPCDQVLDLVLRMNGLGAVREGRVLRAGPVGKLVR